MDFVEFISIIILFIIGHHKPLEKVVILKFAIISYINKQSKNKSRDVTFTNKKKQRCYSDQFTNNQDVIGERLQVKREEIEQSGPNTNT
jgi:hypothetical protein